MSLTNKVIIITGASTGIGYATVRRLLQAGARVAAAARHVTPLATLQTEFPKQLLVKQVDVRQFEQVMDLVTKTVTQFGHVDVLFNNAGVMPVSLLRETRRQDWQTMLDINVMGILNGIAAVLPLMEAQGHGHILTTDSTAGHKTFPKFAVYSSTKFAVRAIMEGLRQEERGYNIKSTLITPGTTKTELYRTIPDEAGRQSELETQANATLLAEDMASAVEFAIDTPDRMAVSEIHVRPTNQEP